ncbi:hypothetical protein Q9Q99_11195 [Curtobacterium flaccumfaciens]|nr:hypothetical protein Q9Q99_11195 [Curtobacterium flaccumfaciens]
MRDDDAGLFGLVGIGGDDLTAIGPDLAAAGSFVVGGPAKSGRSAVLLSMTRSVLREGGEVVLVTPRQSPCAGWRRNRVSWRCTRVPI